VALCFLTGCGDTVQILATGVSRPAAVGRILAPGE
jgi:hypothetical protein